ncbi:hypothetical protein G6O67_006316 [Ophiocordyceps sinensis]|uniref:Uncharacterized protein n=1 Tax=Ophiocordyceps sinensis TaxID=72228 RepID=A0A8H4PM05_9HYPO|nr:hypothetical protein G6O67_006316 [Ophiocordyceps sinensis]
MMPLQGGQILLPRGGGLVSRANGVTADQADRPSAAGSPPASETRRLHNPSMLGGGCGGDRGDSRGGRRTKEGNSSAARCLLTSPCQPSASISRYYYSIRIQMQTIMLAGICWSPGGLTIRDSDPATGHGPAGGRRTRNDAVRAGSPDAGCPWAYVQRLVRQFPAV